MNDSSIITVAVADDHPMVISGLCNMLEHYTDIQLTGKYKNGSELLSGIAASMPDVLLLDIQMPDTTGVELASLLNKRYPALPILALTNLDSVLYAYNMLKYGVKGYLLKSATEAMLVKAIKSVYEGHEFLEEEMKDKLEQFTSKMRRESSLKATLTNREKEILQLIVHGDTTKEISEKLCLGYRTVESYRFNILLKLEAKNTATLVRKAIESGILE